MSRHRWKIFAALTVASVHVAGSAAAEDINPSGLMDQYRKCILVKAAKYAKTNETVGVIAKVSIFACKDSRRAWWDALRIQGMSDSVIMAAIDQVEKMTSETAQVMVLDLRSE